MTSIFVLPIMILSSVSFVLLDTITVSLLLNLLDWLPETTLIEITAYILLVVSIVALAWAVRKNMRPHQPRAYSVTRCATSVAILALIILLIVLRNHTTDTERLLYLIMISYLITAAASALGLKRIKWRLGRRWSLSWLIWRVWFALFDTMIWSCTRPLAIFWHVPDKERKILLITISALLPLESSCWSPSLVVLCGVYGIYQAVDIAWSMEQTSTGVSSTKLANETKLLVRRFDRITVNAFVPTSLAILFGATVSIGIWYIGPRVQSQIITRLPLQLDVPMSPLRRADQAYGQQAEGGNGGSREIEEHGDMEEAGDLGVRDGITHNHEEPEEAVTAEDNV